MNGINKDGNVKILRESIRDLLVHVYVPSKV